MIRLGRGAPVLADAAGLAVLAAISPTAALVSAIYLGAASPRRTVLLYLAGAIVMTGVVGAAAFFVLRAGGLQHASQHSARYGLRLGLGILALLGGVYLLRRGPRAPDPKKSGEGFINKMVSRPTALAAFLVGVVVYSPSVTFIAAVQVVATSKSGAAESALGIILVIVITLAFIWLPYVTFLFWPEQASRRLGAFNAWLRSHGHPLLVGALLVGGLVLILDGALGLGGVIG
jgi:Sap, sulfolipid-1-addressing protein